MTAFQTEWETRTERAQQIKRASDVRLPRLKYWNYGPCAAHADLPEPKVNCEFQACGGELFSHQRVGVMWLYIRKKGLLADLPGLGKTGQALGLLALLKERGELTGRAVIVCQTPAVLQWLHEAARWIPGVATQAIYSGMTKHARIGVYVQNWDVLIIGYHMLQRDWEMLEKLEIKTFIMDDVDPLLNHDTVTHQRIVRLTQEADYSFTMNATSVQTRLEQIHAALLPAGGFEIFGSQTAFENTFFRKERVREVTKSGRVYTKETVTGYKNGELLREKLGPVFLRRTYEDLTDVRIPKLMPPKNVFLELHHPQRLRYKELQDGILRLKREEGETIKHVTALAKLTHGQQICAGLPALGEEDTPESSVKLDWLVSAVTGPWQGRKVVVFIRNIGMVRAAEARLNKAGVGTAKIWGPDSKASVRELEKRRFWSDPNCRVLLGTTAIERSLNFQNANILVNVDMLYNQARMAQLAGRIRRVGSSHEHVFVFNLLAVDTQEDRILDVLKRRQAVADYIWDEESELFEKLSPMELLGLITP
jgi:SNF2 family DNA or RNA helicase